MIGPDDEIVIPTTKGISSSVPDGFNVDYEVELGVVFSRTAKNVSQKNALDYVFGYTLFNDVGARAVQFKNKQVDLGKGFDTFAPMGPCIVTSDEMPDPAKVHIPVDRQRRGAAGRAWLGHDQFRRGADRVDHVDHHLRARRLYLDRNAGRMRHVHEAARLPEGGRRGDRA